MSKDKNHITNRFRGYLPVIVDVETGGFNAEKDALLEIAAITINQDSELNFYPDKEKHYHIEPFPKANISKECLEFNKIDPDHPFRFAVSEKKAFTELFGFLNEIKKEVGCTKCILVGHNSWFDLSFVNAATKRCGIKKSPFHSFTSLDTATLAAAFYGHTVLPQAFKAAKIPFNLNEAHSAIYDAQKTAELFCKMINENKI